jgi:phospholipid transport system substrate-binding protein
MIRRRDFLIFSSLAVAVSFFGAASRAKASGHDRGAEKFISSMAAKALAALTDLKVSRRERAKKFRVLLNDYFAVKAIGRWVLGRYWRRATGAERKEYLGLFEDLLVVTYLDRFTKYSGETLAVSNSIIYGKKDIMVYSQIMRANGEPPLKVEWRVRAKGDGYKIVDVIVAGISMGQTQRSEFASVIRQKGGAIKGLLEELRKRVKLEA